MPFFSGVAGQNRPEVIPTIVGFHRRAFVVFSDTIIALLPRERCLEFLSLNNEPSFIPRDRVVVFEASAGRGGAHSPRDRVLSFEATAGRGGAFRPRDRVLVFEAPAGRGGSFRPRDRITAFATSAGRGGAYSPRDRVLDFPGQGSRI